MASRRFAPWWLALCLLPCAAGAAEPGASELPLSVGGRSTAALWLRPEDARALLVLGHGAQTNMRSPFLTSLAEALARRGVATLRFDFPYAHAGASQPDPPGVLQATVRAALAEAEKRRGTLPLLVGGTSLSTLVVVTVLGRDPPPVAGAVLLAFPLHAPGRPSARNARGLDATRVPLLFVQGTSDPLADLGLMRALVERLGPRARLHQVEGTDHRFERGGELEPARIDGIAEAIARFAATLPRASQETQP